MNFKKIKSLLFLIFRVSLSFGILFYLFKRTDFSQLKILFAQIDLNYYFLALFCVIIFQSLVALRWKKICAAWGFEESFFFYLKSYLMGFSLNTLFPGVVAGDTLRGFNLYKRGLEWKKTSLSVVLDRVFGLMGIMFILTFSLRGGANFLPDKFRILLQFIVYSSIFAFVGIVLFLTFFSKTTFFNPLKLPYVIVPLVLGIIIQIFFVFQFLFLGKALNLPLRFSYYFMIIPIVSFLSALPLSISGLGLREGTLSYFLHLLNYPIEYGISLGLLAYSLILLSAIPGIILYFRGKWS
ncbi:MAG: lysylphosphatidylglycerol synthase transmembrane domain-containing protein [Caldimicrobium thiodismutans]